MTSPFAPPSIHDPESVHVAYRAAKLAWDVERAALLMASAGGAANGKYVTEALAFAQADTLDTATLYIMAIREAHPALREAQTA